MKPGARRRVHLNSYSDIKFFQGLQCNCHGLVKTRKGAIYNSAIEIFTMLKVQTAVGKPFIYVYQH